MIGLFYASEQWPNPKTPVYLLESILQFQYIHHIDAKDNSVRSKSIYITLLPALGMSLAVTESTAQDLTANFTRIQAETFGSNMALSNAWGDYDGYLDLYIGSNRQGNELFHNDKSQGFTEVTDELGVGIPQVSTRQISWVDFDNNGTQDLFVADRVGSSVLFSNIDDEFVEVFLDVSLEIAEGRDPKGLYRKARQGELPHFTGIDSPYEVPETAELILDTDALSVEQCVDKLMAFT